jgi:streptogramin lyase
VIFARESAKESGKGAGEWKEIKSIDLFERPTYCCAGLKGQVWIADQGMGRIVAVDPKKWQLTEWSFPAKGQPKIDDLRGIGCDEKAGDLLYIEGKARQLLRQHVQ